MPDRNWKGYNEGLVRRGLTQEMWGSFKRTEEFLDLEIKREDPLLKQKEEFKHVIESGTPEQMQAMFKTFARSCSESSGK